jgi:hypothetical protein
LSGDTDRDFDLLPQDLFLPVMMEFISEHLKTWRNKIIILDKNTDCSVWKVMLYHSTHYVLHYKCIQILVWKSEWKKPKGGEFLH